MRKNWARLAVETGLLAWEAQQVIALRLAKIALGGAAARREQRLMAAEKLAALQETALEVATGATARSIVKGYRQKVRRNRRRLTRPPQRRHKLE